MFDSARTALQWMRKAWNVMDARRTYRPLSPGHDRYLGDSRADRSGLAGLHALMAGWHHIVLRDGTLRWMSPL
jgi:hypothetical protein